MTSHAITFLLLSAAIYFARSNYLFLRWSVQTPGIANYEEERGRRGGILYRLVVTYHDDQGNERTYRSSGSSSFRSYEPGQALTIAYDPSRPDYSGPYTFAHRFGFAWVFLSMAVGWAVMCVGFLNGDRWMAAIFG